MDEETKFIDETTNHIQRIFGATRGDAQGIIEAQNASFKIFKEAGYNPEEIAQLMFDLWT